MCRSTDAAASSRLDTPLWQVALERKHLTSPGPGHRSLVLTGKPAHELRPSARKRIQGMLEFSLEMPRTTEPANCARTGAAGELASIGSRPVDESRSKEIINTPPRHGDSRAKNARPGIPGGNVDAQGKVSTMPCPTVAAKLKRRGDQEISQEEIVSMARSEEVFSDESEWEGLTWTKGDEGHVGNPGTVRAASDVAEQIRQGRSTAADPEDLLVRLKSVTGLRKVTTPLS